MKKRLLAWILALVMLAALLPTTVLAEDAAVDYSSQASIEAAKKQSGQQDNDLFWYVGADKTKDSVYAFLTAEEGTIYQYSYTKGAGAAAQTAVSANTWDEYKKIRGWDDTYVLSDTESTAKQAYSLVVFGTGAMGDGNNGRVWGDYAYQKYADQIVSFEIRNGITEVGTHAFRKLFSLIDFDLVLPTSVTVLQGECFESSAIRKVELRDGIGLEWSAFCDCRVTEGELYVPLNNGYLPKYCFANTGFSKITIAEGFEEFLDHDYQDGKPISDYSSAFQGCRNITEIVLPTTLKRIGNSAFAYCTNLKKVVFGDKLIALDAHVFNDTALEAVILPQGLKKIGEKEFWNCNKLHSVYIPESVTEFGTLVFAWNRTTEVPTRSYTIYCQSDAVRERIDETDAKALSNRDFQTKWYAAYAVTNGGIFPLTTEFESGKLAAPVRDGYKFEGWYESEDFSGSAVTDASVGKTYYAKWTEDKDDSIYGQSKNVDLGIIAEGGSTSATVGFTGSKKLVDHESDHNYFTADISGTTVTITPVDGLKPGTYNDTIYVYTETGATHFIYVTLTVTEKSADADQPQGDLPFWLLAAIGSNPFSDVAGGAYYNEAVRWAVKNGIASGTDAKHFSPDAACTRGQAVTFLWRAAGCPAPALAENPFADVKPTDYCYDAVLWAVQTGVAKGTSASTFSPDAACTRGQIVTFLYRAAGSPSGYGNSGYTDVPETGYCAAPVAWAVALRVTSGTSAITFSPDALCTRAQIVTFLYRANA